MKPLVFLLVFMFLCLAACGGGSTPQAAIAPTPTAMPPADTIWVANSQCDAGAAGLLEVPGDTGVYLWPGDGRSDFLVERSMQWIPCSDEFVLQLEFYDRSGELVVQEFRQTEPEEILPGLYSWLGVNINER